MDRRRVLIVTSSFEPAMTADMQRARMLAWELPRLGWDVEVLCPDTTFQNPLTVESDGAQFFPRDLPVHRVSPWIPSLFRLLGVRTIGLRSLFPIYRRGIQILRERRFDLVYFSTTQFVLSCLGPLWMRAAGTRYVVDIHDPWYRASEKYATTKHAMKRRISTPLNRVLERFAMRRAHGCVSVSPVYLADMERRYESDGSPWIHARSGAVIPFGVRLEDFDVARKGDTSSTPPRAPNQVRIVYVGVGGPIMVESFRTICHALSTLRATRPDLTARLSIELFGTMLNWETGDRKHLEEVAIECGVLDLVCERPERVSYRKSLEILLGADGALVLGVDDPAYIPSKLFAYSLSERPVLACLRRGSPGTSYFSKQAEMGHLIEFGNDTPTVENSPLIAFLEEAVAGRSIQRRASLRSLTAAAMAEAHAELFATIAKQRDPR